MKSDAERRPRIIFVNRFFYPDTSATSQILTDLATYLTTVGWSVSVITSRLHGSSADAAALGPAAKINVERVWSTHRGAGSKLGKLFDYSTFYVSAVLALWRDVRANDIVIAKTDPPLISVAVMAVCRHRGAAQVNWLQDLYPEVAQELRAPLLGGRLGAVLRRLRNASLRNAQCNVAIGTLMARRLEKEGVATDQIEVIPNWADEHAIQPQSAAQSSLRASLGYTASEVVVGYSGNLGRAHESATLLGAAQLLASRSHIQFLIIGRGAELDLLRRRVREIGLSNIRFEGHQPRTALADTLSAADVHWLSLRPELEGLIVPSKFYGILAAGRPVVAVVGRDGEIASEIARIGCGFTVEPGDARGLANAIEKLANDEQLRAQFGERGRAEVNGRLSKHSALEKWGELLERIDNASPSANGFSVL